MNASTMHLRLRTALKEYITSQYFGKSQLLLDALGGQLDEKGILYQEPYLEASPAYETSDAGFAKTAIPDWQRTFLASLSDAGLGVYSQPYRHQLEALEAAEEGRDVVVTTGTGSGKTECFMWPLLTKLAREAHDAPDTWSERGVRCVILYPMNALVSDQVSRMRQMIGDSQGSFQRIFADTCGSGRVPRFGMYTGRTPYPGPAPKSSEDSKLARTLARFLKQEESSPAYFQELLKQGRIPAKTDLRAFQQSVRDGRHIPGEHDAELVTRFEMQNCCPDILITNYSMLELMLFRPQEQSLWDSTVRWLKSSAENRLMLVIDEAHMYRGAAGGEVALLIRRLFNRLGIDRDRVQCFLTSASVAVDSSTENAVQQFARNLTALDSDRQFVILSGHEEECISSDVDEIPVSYFNEFSSEELMDEQGTVGPRLTEFLSGLRNAGKLPENTEVWLYENLPRYAPFQKLLRTCRGNAVALSELAQLIFPTAERGEAEHALDIMLTVAPMARDAQGRALFPARLHMLFKGIPGVYACTNPECPGTHSHAQPALGAISLDGQAFMCPHCQSMMYELINDRRCGALFLRGYLLEDPRAVESVYLWPQPGSSIDQSLQEVHLYIPVAGEKPRRSDKVFPCYLDTRSGFLYGQDDTHEGKEGFLKLYYSDYTVKVRPDIKTWSNCPHCGQQFSSRQLTSFATRGNLAFHSIVQSQFNALPAEQSRAAEPEKYPNAGRKILLFSDSRQRAAKLARDMSKASDHAAMTQLISLALRNMELSEDVSLHDLYGYVCKEAANQHLMLFHGPEREDFAQSQRRLERRSRRNARGSNPFSRLDMDKAGDQMKAALLRSFCGGFNTLYDCALGWIEPTEETLSEAVMELTEAGIEVSDAEFLELFNAWFIQVCDPRAALGSCISDDVRSEVRPNYDGFGLKENWEFTTVVRKAMDWAKTDPAARTWKEVLDSTILDGRQYGRNALYIDLKAVRGRLGLDHPWYICPKCSRLTPFTLRRKCPHCGSDSVRPMTEQDYAALEYWRRPILEALNGAQVHVINTEEHTAQLSHKDQRDNLWSQTETYEMRFQDLIDPETDEGPVDILSCTTTMEVGIDIGSLLAVGMRNMPPKRENYQQRAGRAGRRGAGLSAIVTFCEDGPHDMLYFNDPAPMFRGDPRIPWIDVESPKLQQRHLAMIVLQDFIRTHDLRSLDELPATDFLDNYLEQFVAYLQGYRLTSNIVLPAKGAELDLASFRSELIKAIRVLKERRDAHPELYETSENGLDTSPKTLLDAMYEDGIIPTYSFPKNVVSAYIPDTKTQGYRTAYQIERGLDFAISEYAPGRTIVVDKQTYRMGGLFLPGAERLYDPAQKYIEDANYNKSISYCTDCGWFGLSTEASHEICPFCGSQKLKADRPMLRPWGFIPEGGRSIPEAQTEELHSFAMPPCYSTLPSGDEIHPVSGFTHLRAATRANQRIIMLNRGPAGEGFAVCRKCGAAVAGLERSSLEKRGRIKRPYPSLRTHKECVHDPVEVNLGFDFVTDMLVLEVFLDDKRIDTRKTPGTWLERAAPTLAEAMRLAACAQLDIEFGELVTGYRLRSGSRGTFVDLYLYDNTSSGAGYATEAALQMPEILERVRRLLVECDCETACRRCLKHYLNRFSHSVLDRKAGFELFRWAENSELAPPLTLEEQMDLWRPFVGVFAQQGIKLSEQHKRLYFSQGSSIVETEIVPAMTFVRDRHSRLLISDAWVKYSRPYAFNEIKRVLTSRRSSGTR